MNYALLLCNSAFYVLMFGSFFLFAQMSLMFRREAAFAFCTIGMLAAGTVILNLYQGTLNIDFSMTLLNAANAGMHMLALNNMESMAESMRNASLKKITQQYPKQTVHGPELVMRAGNG